MCTLCGTEHVNRGASTNRQELNEEGQQPHQIQQQQQQQQQQQHHHQSGNMSHENVQPPMHIGHPLTHRPIYNNPSSNKRPKLWQKLPLPTPPPPPTTTTYNYSEIDERIRELDAKVKKAWAVIAAYRKNMAKYREEIVLLGRHKQQQQQPWIQRAASAENFQFLDTSPQHMPDQ